MLLFKIALLGGLFAVLAFIHFFVDWIFQSHSEAMVKHNNANVRAKHCLIYTLGFAPLFYFCSFNLIEWAVAVNILFWSHFCEDTYIPVYLWAKYIRRPPEMTKPRKKFIGVHAKGHDEYETLPPDPKAGFADWVQTTMGKILMIAIDQIIHLAFLIPVAYMIMHKLMDQLSMQIAYIIELIIHSAGN